MEVEKLSSVTVKGVKRRYLNDQENGASVKRARHTAVDIGSPDSSVTSDDDLDGRSELSDEELVSSATTPISQTLGNSRQSSQTPSNLKTQPCPYPDCPKLFNRRARLNAHIRSHTNTRPFVCPHSPCTKDFLRNEHLQRHIKSAHTDIRDYICPHDGCGKSYSTGTRLRRHVAAHEAREPYTCKAIGCGQAFRKHATLQAHVASVHEGKAPYVCTEIGIHGGPCSDGFETTAKLKYHKNRVHGAAKYWCTLCGDETHQSNGQEEESIMDSPSGVPFSSYSAFQAHKRTVHPLKCSNCGYQTGYPGDLNRHCEIHHDDQDLAEGMTHHCIESDCWRSFTRRGNLLIHMKIAHAQGKPYVCGAVDLSELNRIANWSGQDACGRGFATKPGLVKHIQIAHLCLDKNQIGEVRSIRPRNQKAPALARLTGTSKIKHPSIACLRLDCDKRFSVEYEHEMHLQSAHGMADFEIQYLRSEHNDHSLSTYGEWLTRKDDAEIQRTLNDQLTSTPLNQDTRTTLQENTEIALNRAAGLGGQFWVGGVGLEDMEEIDWDAEERVMRSMNEENQWEADAREMRLLIREDGNIDDMAIDPNLG